MSIAALIAWVITAAGGFVLLGTWLTRGGTRAPRTSHFPPALIFGHFALAAAGLVVWIIYLFANQTVLAWIAFVLLVPVALLGFTMLARWIPVYRSRTTVTAGSGGGPDATAAGSQAPAEQHFPVVVVGAHGVLAVVTVVLVLLTALGVGR
ncbi:MAG TPA: hypothetical protein VFX16_17835 [Pseudonocardiaceae bacterium]|nr:hypothetical protein [Pseudonocardiaceae bacterium]